MILILCSWLFIIARGFKGLLSAHGITKFGDVPKVQSFYIHCTGYAGCPFYLKTHVLQYWKVFMLLSQHFLHSVFLFSLWMPVLSFCQMLDILIHPLLNWKLYPSFTLELFQWTLDTETINPLLKLGTRKYNLSGCLKAVYLCSHLCQNGFLVPSAYLCALK